MQAQALNVLIVDDEQELRRSIASVIGSTLREFVFRVDEASTGLDAIAKVRSKAYDLILMDVRMPEMDGLEALEQIKIHDPKTFVVIMTAHSNFQDAVKAIKSGAYDYLAKPIQPEKLAQIVKKAIETQEMVSDIALSNPILDEDIDSEFVGHSEKMGEVFTLINRLSQVDTTVLIRGENGTGKELVAKAIHFNSPRKHGEFIAINCAAIPDNLIESELFGHEKGAFTGATDRKVGQFQLANKGTLFLDEIAELKPELQAKLLRVLQEKCFIPVGGNREVKTNARIITATNRNLEKMIEDHDFREDLFYRLNVMPIFIPPLRDRKEDIEHLIDYFIRRFNRKHGRKIGGVAPDAMDVLRNYTWPGNIRELENVVERSFIIENSNSISLSSIPEQICSQVKNQVHIDFPHDYSGPLDFDRFKEETEKEFIVKALKANNGKINKTVAEANIPKNTLLRKIKKYSIDVKQFLADSQ